MAKISAYLLVLISSLLIIQVACTKETTETPEGHLAAIRAAAAAGDGEAQLILGVIFEEGHGLGRDSQEAVFWYTEAAEQGSLEAQLILADIYSAGRFGLQDVAEAKRWWKMAARQGDARAQAILGGIFADGESVTRDDAEAGRWYRKAAEQGLADAQFILGVMYAVGRGGGQRRERSRSVVAKGSRPKSHGCTSQSGQNV